jgi:acyl-CoA synthetase (AMP-forming)/AMP-acid ligase II
MRLRLLICAGEVLPRQLVQRLTGLRVLNAYGPTEAAVCATIGDAQLGERRVPIGHPLLHTTVTIRDALGWPVPAGTAGEIVISGPKLAHGYLNRPAETERAFVIDPEGPPGSMMLRTGDMGRYGSSGIEYLGRADRQVKIRGQRLELEEVDRAVAAVVCQPAAAELTEVDGHVVLAAVVLSAQEDPRPAQVLDNAVTAEYRRQLVDRLPEWAIPSFFVSVKSMPLSSSGKVDRARLRELLAAAVRPGSQDAAPAEWTAVEAAVARTWESLLGKEVDSRERTFFELGGHSMLVAKAIRRIRELTQKDLPVTEFFAHPTVAGIAAALERLT